MLRDVIPKASTEDGLELLQESLTRMFDENPEFVANFVAETISGRKKLRKKATNGVLTLAKSSGGQTGVVLSNYFLENEDF